MLLLLCVCREREGGEGEDDGGKERGVRQEGGGKKRGGSERERGQKERGRMVGPRREGGHKTRLTISDYTLLTDCFHISKLVSCLLCPSFR